MVNSPQVSNSLVNYQLVYNSNSTRKHNENMHRLQRDRYIKILEKTKQIEDKINLLKSNTRISDNHLRKMTPEEESQFLKYSRVLNTYGIRPIKNYKSAEEKIQIQSMLEKRR